MNRKNYSFKLDTAENHRLKDGSYPLMLVIRKNGQRKIIYLRSSASYVEVKKKDGKTEIKSQWNKNFQRFEVDGRKELHPDRITLNLWLDELSGRCDEIIKDFEKKKTDWTLNQFEQAFLNNAKNTGVESYFQQHIDKLSRAGKIGNKICYERTLYMLKLYDPKFGRLVFNEIDLKYVRGFHDYLQVDRGCVGNTIKYYMKAFRALLNLAIKNGEASLASYPFGKNGYSISQLGQETNKRYLPTAYIESLKTASLDTYPLNWCRNLFLFSYYCQGMAIVDMAGLTSENIITGENGRYIVYRRQKTEGKNTTFIRIKITPNIQNLLDWAQQDKTRVQDYLLPIVSIKGYEGEKLYTHIRDRYKRYNRHLKKLGEKLKFEGIRLSSYMSRHSYAMRLKNSGISEDVISEALGHKDLSTTKIYLDSFGNDEIALANELL